MQSASHLQVSTRLSVTARNLQHLQLFLLEHPTLESKKSLNLLSYHTGVCAG